MCAASQQIDVIPNQGHDGIEAGNLGLMLAHARPRPLFTLGLTKSGVVLAERTSRDTNSTESGGYYRKLN